MAGILPLTGDEVIISERGGTNPRRLEVMQPSGSWELGAAGMFSAFVAVPDLIRAGFPLDLKARWLSWESPAGRWGGVITATPMTDGIAELSAMSWPILLRGRVLDGQPITAPPGAVMRQLLQGAVRSEPTFLTIGQMDESGELISVDYDGQDAYDVLGSIDGEWLVDQERRFHFGQRVGVDRSNEIRLVEGRHIANYRLADDLWIISNRLVGASADTDVDLRRWMKKLRSRVKRRKRLRKKGAKKRARKITVSRPMEELQVDPFTSLTLGSYDSIVQYGPLERVMEYPDLRDMGSIEARLNRDLADLSNPPKALDLALIDVDGCYRAIGEGDIVWVDLGSAGLTGAFRVLNRSVGDGGSLRVAGDFRPVRSS